MGHKIDALGLHPNTAKIEVVVDTPTLKNFNLIYIGLLNYHGHFLPEMMQLRIKSAISKDQKCKWPTVHQQALTQ